MDPDADGQDLREFYANLFQIGFNSAEFLLDFGREFEETPKRFCCRIVTTPFFARTLLRLLEDSVRGYEERFGEIPVDLNP